MTSYTDAGRRYRLESPTFAPKAAAFLWNRRLMLQATCRGYAVAQFMQPEPAKYAHVPTLAGTSFMQPEQPYFAQHPGRFFYLRDDESASLWSAPYEPVRAPLDRFAFEPGLSDIRWTCAKDGIEMVLTLSLAPDEIAEVWTVSVSNLSPRSRSLSFVPYFPVGYSSWMNMGGRWQPDLNALVCSCVAPYQKLEDYFKRKEWKDLTYLLADRVPDSHECSLEAFEGEGGRHDPDALRRPALAGGQALYEMPACALRYQLALAPGAVERFEFLFGPAKDHAEIAAIRTRLLGPAKAAAARESYAAYVESGRGCLSVATPDPHFDAFVNHWLPRQVFYHGDTNRLTTDPQTRNYLQDAMGMAYIHPAATRRALATALSQQKSSGSMPDGILLHPDAELKYINKIPHADHPVWLAICLQAYLDETADHAFLDEQLPFADSPATASVYQHMSLGIDWLCAARDHRGLSFIEQGDWCDPMNMVGYKGKGVSGWLTEAVSYALQLWIPHCLARGDTAQAARRQATRQEINAALNTHLWDGAWYGRGITDDNLVFGISTDPEGRIFLNAQSWALLCGAPDGRQTASLLAEIDKQLETPFGPMMFAPAYTAMRDDVGRVTQKFPGSAENGAVYNHAAAFYAASLYHVRHADAAYSVLRRMIPGPAADDLARRGQMPLYLPNYYRGAYHQHPAAAGRSSQLFNTGTAAWFYRLLVEQLFGLRGTPTGLSIQPQLPSSWPSATATRSFRGATIHLSCRRVPGIDQPQVTIDGALSPARHLDHPVSGQAYAVEVLLPAT